MNIGFYGLIIIFAAFIILLIINPKLSCFGRRIASPFYPILRHRRRKNGRAGRQAPGASPDREAAKPPRRTEDYGFHLEDEKEGKPGSHAPGPSAPGQPQKPGQPKKAGKHTEDYGFHLDK